MYMLEIQIEVRDYSQTSEGGQQGMDLLMTEIAAGKVLTLPAFQVDEQIRKSVQKGSKQMLLHRIIFVSLQNYRIPVGNGNYFFDDPVTREQLEYVTSLFDTNRSSILYWIPYAGCFAKIEVRIPNISVIPEAGVIQHNDAVHLPVVIFVLSVLLRCVIRMP